MARSPLAKETDTVQHWAELSPRLYSCASPHLGAKQEDSALATKGIVHVIYVYGRSPWVQSGRCCSHHRSHRCPWMPGTCSSAACHPLGCPLTLLRQKQCLCTSAFTHHCMLECASFDTKIFVSLDQFDRMKPFWLHRMGEALHKDNKSGACAIRGMTACPYQVRE